MMRFVCAAVVALGLLSVGQSAPVTNCESLIQPAEITGREQLLGKWWILAESTNIPGSKILTKMFVNNAWVKITAAEESDAINVLQSQKVFGRCFTVTTKMTLENSTLTIVQPVNASEIFLNTRCPDCLVISAKYNMGRTFDAIQFLSRRNNVSAAELEDFTKQVECMNLPSPAILDLQHASCPDDAAPQNIEITDLTSFINKQDTDIFDLFDSIVNSEGGINKLIDMISTTMTELKDNQSGQ